MCLVDFTDNHRRQLLKEQKRYREIASLRSELGK